MTDALIIFYTAITFLLLGIMMAVTPNRVTLVDSMFTVREFVLFLFTATLAAIISHEFQVPRALVDFVRVILILMNSIILVYITVRAFIAWRAKWNDRHRELPKSH
jgi:hypothetical protein